MKAILITGGTGSFTSAAKVTLREGHQALAYAYPGRYLCSAAYIAAQYPAETSAALTRLQTWWTFVKTQIDANGLFHANGYPTYTYTAHQFELLIYVCAASRLLRNQLGANATAVTLGNDMIAVMNTLGKACIDRLARQSLTVSAAGAADATPSTASAWARTTRASSCRTNPRRMYNPSARRRPASHGSTRAGRAPPRIPSPRPPRGMRLPSRKSRWFEGKRRPSGFETWTGTSSPGKDFRPADRPTGTCSPIHHG